MIRSIWARESGRLVSRIRYIGLTLYRRGVVNKSILCVSALIVLGTAAATAEEMASPPASFITRQAPYQTWAGLYFGVNGGYGWGNSSVIYTPNDPGTVAGLGAAGSVGQSGMRRDGPLTGGQIGFNWQFNSLWLAGVEADFQWSDFNGTAYSPFHLAGVGSASTLSTFAAEQTIQSFGTLRARVGAMPLESLLLYGTGGLAYGNVKESLNLATSATGGATGVGGLYSYKCTAGGPACFTGSPSQIRVGLAAGVGAEYAITTFLTFKTEFLYLYLEAPSGTATATALNTPGTIPSSFTASLGQVNAIIVRGGLNYRF
jgi:outer membrane immunogenic protein